MQVIPSSDNFWNHHQKQAFLLTPEAQDPQTWKVKKKAIYYDKKQHVDFLVKPFFQATKQHLNNTLRVKNKM